MTCSLPFNHSTKPVLDDIAPVKIKVFSDKSETPWLTDELIRRRKRDCRKAEFKCCKTKLLEHPEIYKNVFINYS